MFPDIVDSKLTPPVDSATILISYCGPAWTFKKKASSASYREKSFKILNLYDFGRIIL